MAVISLTTSQRQQLQHLARRGRVLGWSAGLKDSCGWTRENPP